MQLLVFMFFIGIISLNIRKKKDSPISVLMRILTNYFQLTATSLAFDLQFPSSLLSAMKPLESIGSSDQSFFSFDCFMREYDVKGPFPSNSILKLFLLALLPIILFLIISSIWIIVKIIKPTWVTELKRNLAITFISIVFLLHPTLTQNALRIFQ